jgi:hypothetical protein
MMKSMTTKLVITAAALALATGIASAQSFRAEIPFAFQAGGKTMAPGIYRVDVQYSGHKLVTLSNYVARQTIFLSSGAGADAPKDWTAVARPVITFECGIGRCALARLWTGSGEPALTFHHPSLGSDVKASLTNIPLVKVDTD